MHRRGKLFQNTSVLMALRLPREFASLCVSEGAGIDANVPVDDSASCLVIAAMAISTSASSNSAVLSVVLFCLSTASSFSRMADVSLLDDAAPVIVQHRLSYCSYLRHFPQM